MPADEEGTPVLRTVDGDRVYDAGDVPALLALAELSALIDRSWTRHVAHGEMPTSAAERHRREFGHRLAFGCCRLPFAS